MITPKEKEPFYQNSVFLVIAVIAIVSYLFINKNLNTVSSPFETNETTSEKNISTNNSHQTNESNDEANNANKDSYSGVYSDLDRRTGWQTTVTITGGSFYASTVAPTGDIIASGSGDLQGHNLVDRYGQNIGYVSGASLSITLGAANIDCIRK